MENEIFQFDDLPNSCGSNTLLLNPPEEPRPGVIFFENPHRRQSTSSDERPPMFFTADPKTPEPEPEPNAECTAPVEPIPGRSDARSLNSMATTAEATDNDVIINTPDTDTETDTVSEAPSCQARPFLWKYFCTLFLAFIIAGTLRFMVKRTFKI